jgi:uncharacterized NAD(P)/FAD-binding protein YdhS
MDSRMTRIIIVGAGFSGTLVAAHLLRTAGRPLTVYLVDRSTRQFGRGIAYGTDMDCHLLNVPAGRMSAFPDEPNHFLDWARQRAAGQTNSPWLRDISPESFLPRRLYGDYVSWVLGAAERAARPGVRLVKIVEEAVRLGVGQSGVEIGLGSGEILRADRLVLALGNFRPNDPVLSDRSFYDSSRYHSDPWAPGVVAALARTDSCFLIGSGLTMVDCAIALAESDYRGTLHVISRRGTWPTPYRACTPIDANLETNPPVPRVRTLMRTLRRRIHPPAGEAPEWRAIIDGLRPYTPALWQSLPLGERRRFLRHARPYWDVHRHRLAPAIAERLKGLADAGQLIRHVGRILEFRESDAAVEVLIRRRGTNRIESVTAEAVVNCSGPESNYRKLNVPLVVSLLEQGLGRPDSLSLGLDVAADGALIGADGAPSRQIYTLGPPQKGVFWETTAVPEIRVQAARLARTLLE